MVGGGWIFQTPEFTHTHTCVYTGLPYRQSTGWSPVQEGFPQLWPHVTHWICTWLHLFVSLAGLNRSRGERRLWATHLPACLRPWESRDRNLARPSWSAQQQPRQVPKSAETDRGVLEVQVPRHVFPPEWEPQGWSRSGQGDSAAANTTQVDSCCYLNPPVQARECEDLCWSFPFIPLFIPS